MPTKGTTENPSGLKPPLDHAHNIAERYFQVHSNELHVGGMPITEIVREFGSPIFVYSHEVILDKVRRVLSMLPRNFKLFYSIKANPNRNILRTMLAEGCGLEVASAGELHQALSAGCPRNKIVFAGPGKKRSELQLAVEEAIAEIHVESLAEARCIDELALARNCVANIAVRVNPVTGAGGAMRMGGLPSPFGIDEEELDSALSEIQRLPNVRMSGVHLYMATQILNAETLLAQYDRAVAIARHVAAQIPHPLTTIDFGGGWGTPYFANEQPLDLRVVEQGLSQLAEQMKSDPQLTQVTGLLEPGRFLVSEAGIYVTRVTRIKQSRGKTFAVVDGGMHHHLAASGNLGQTIKRNYPVAVLTRMENAEREKISVTGPLCTPLDMLARDADLPPMQTGDLVGVFQSGAYARTASPHGFLSHPSPAEVMIHDGTATLVRRPGNSDDLLRDQFPDD